uniref:Uncharacterized protein n=1 Tax=Arundo donax TaxID=35708 RepID=A0A0A8Z4A0_ARUDO
MDILLIGKKSPPQAKIDSPFPYHLLAGR